MKDFQENIVPATNQNSTDIFLGRADGSPRVLFVGNSITRHGRKPDIGWDRDCGMAASDAEHDYVHVFARRFLEKYPNAGFGILQAANFERQFDKGMELEKVYREVIDWKPDIVVMFFGANVSRDYDAAETHEISFGSRYGELRDLLDSGKTLFFHSEGFYLRPVLDGEKKQVCEAHGDTWIPLGDINSREDAHGMFNHPGDLGMKLIADRFFDYVTAGLSNITEF